MNYRACIPVYNENFPNHTVTKKDAWIEAQYQMIVKERMLIESDELDKEEGLSAGSNTGEAPTSDIGGSVRDVCAATNVCVQSWACARSVAGIDEYGYESEEGTAQRFNPEGRAAEEFAEDCQNAFRNYFCWINFPRCNEVRLRCARPHTLLCTHAIHNIFLATYPTLFWSIDWGAVVTRDARRRTIR